jgi:hypothetical protein
MAHTTRNRRNVPTGWEVRDGGAVVPTNGEDHVPRFRRSIYACEKKRERKRHQRRFRAAVRAWLHHARDEDHWDDDPIWRRTSGWLTW